MKFLLNKSSIKISFFFYFVLLLINTNLQAQCGLNGFFFTTQAEVDNFQIEYPNCTVIEGTLRLSGDITSLLPLANITHVQGNLEIQYLNELLNFDGLENLTTVDGHLRITQNWNAFTNFDMTALQQLHTVGGDVQFWRVNDFTGLEQLTSIGGKLSIRESEITNLNTFGNLTNLHSLNIYNCEFFNSFSGLNNFSTIAGDILVVECPSLTNVIGLDNFTTINGNLILRDNENMINIQGLNNLVSVIGKVEITENINLQNFSGLDNLTSIGGNLLMWDNYAVTSLTGFEQLQSIGGGLNINDFTLLPNLLGLSNLQTIGGWIDIRNLPLLTNFNGLQNLVTMGASRIWLEHLDNLVSFDGIENLNLDDVLIRLFFCDALTSFAGLEHLTTANGFDISRCANLTNMNGLENMTSGGLRLLNNPALTNLSGLENMVEANYINIAHNDALTSIEALGNLQTINGVETDSGFTPDLNILKNEALISLTGLENLTDVVGHVTIRENHSLTNLIGLEGLTTGIGRYISIYENHFLQTLEGLDNLNSVTEDLSVYKNFQLKNVNHLQSLTTLGGVLQISINGQLENLDGLENLTQVDALWLEENASLSDITALNNVLTIDKTLKIKDNPLLSLCAQGNICSHLLVSNSLDVISNNASGCTSIEEVLFGCNESVGKLFLPVFYDENQNGIKEQNEIYLPFGIVQIEPVGITNIPNTTNGGFKFLEYGEYVVNYDGIDFWTMTTPSSYNVTLDALNPEKTIHFGLIPSGSHSAMEIAIANETPRCNDYATFEVIATNIGTTITNGTIHFNIDETITGVNYIDTPDGISDFTYSWNFTDLLPGQTIKKRISLELPGPPEAEVGEWVSFFSQVDFTDVNGTHSSLQFPLRIQIECAYDPNDKLVQPNYPENYALIGDALFYTVRFQNTGNAEAYDVTIEDEIDPNLDLSTFRVISSSHEEVLSTFFKDRLVSFEFKDIFLPDSTTNFDASQGYVMYRISPHENIDENTIIENTADIYFDNNPPVITNTTDNNMVSTFDADQDGAMIWEDCDDNNATINPGVAEIPNNDIDENCDGLAQTIDMDGDGFNSDDDCDDNDSTIYPGAMEVANNNIDEDCDGEVTIIDADNDGFNSDEDCDDSNPAINPNATEIAGNDIDEDCDGEAISTSTTFIENNKIIALPNPLTERLIIEQSSTMYLQYELIDQTGRILSTGEFNQRRQIIELDDLVGGMYFLKIYDTASQKSVVQKLMKF